MPKKRKLPVLGVDFDIVNVTPMTGSWFKLTPEQQINAVINSGLGNPPNPGSNFEQNFYHRIGTFRPCW